MLNILIYSKINKIANNKSYYQIKYSSKSQPCKL